MKIRFFYDNINFRLKRSKEIKSFIEKVIRDEGKIPGDLVFVFCGDKMIREINKEFLSHDYFTDVISFNYSARKTINGEIYLSIDTIFYNANKYKVPKKEELFRAMIHGTLHLLGYDDTKVRDKKIMIGVQEKRLLELMGGK